MRYDVGTLRGTNIRLRIHFLNICTCVAMNLGAKDDDIEQCDGGVSVPFFLYCSARARACACACACTCACACVCLHGIVWCNQRVFDSTTESACGVGRSYHSYILDPVFYNVTDVFDGNALGMF